MKIGELAAATQTPVETIRYYEREGLLPQTIRSDSNYRIYNDGHVDRLSFIRHCRRLDMSLGEIRSLLQFKDAPTASCEAVNALLDEHIGHVSARIKELRALEKELKSLRQRCGQTPSATHCGILAGLSQPPSEMNPDEASHVSGVHGGIHSCKS